MSIAEEKCGNTSPNGSSSSPGRRIYTVTSLAVGQLFRLTGPSSTTMTTESTSGNDPDSVFREEEESAAVMLLTKNGMSVDLDVSAEQESQPPSLGRTSSSSSLTSACREDVEEDDDRSSSSCSGEEQEKSSLDVQQPPLDQPSAYATKKRSFSSDGRIDYLDYSLLLDLQSESQDEVAEPILPRRLHDKTANSRRPRGGVGVRVANTLARNKQRASNLMARCGVSPEARRRRKLRRRSRTGASETERPRSEWLIPANHPYKIIWDVATVTLSVLGAYTTHASIRDRSFGHSFFVVFCELWFFLDILLNFVTEHKSADGATVIRDGKTVWARYLTTWFVVDALSLIPWEHIYVKPIIEMQKRRNFFKKTFFRSKAVVRVTRVLRGRHFRLFGKVASRTKRHAGVSGKRLLRLLIKYIPKYLMFFRNMKGVLAVRTLRQVHWFRKVMKNVFLKNKENPLLKSNHEEEDYDETDDDDDSLTTEESEEDDEDVEELDDDEEEEELDEDYYWVDSSYLSSPSPTL